MLALDFCLFLGFALFTSTNGHYLITTPRKWISGNDAQVCFTLTTPSSSQDILSLELSLIPDYYQRLEGENITTVLQTDFIIHNDGKSTKCETVKVPDVGKSRYKSRLQFFGTINGKDIKHDVNGSIIGSEKTGKTFVQTDKYLYKPGQEVNIRILTVYGPSMTLSTKPYPEIFIQSPSKTRLAQWRDVNNTNGLIHLKFQLADEPDYGTYSVVVKSPYSSSKKKNFRVSEYVLPKFEVTLKPPAYITAVDEEIKFSVCAKYTFGQPVKGKVNVTVSNNAWRSCSNTLTKSLPISGCQDITFITRKLRFQTDGCRVYRLSVNAKVIEEGTGITLHSESKDITVHDTIINFNSIDIPNVIKHGFPFEGKVKAAFPDDSPAPNEPVEVCWNLPRIGHCKNLTSDVEGNILFTLPTYTPYTVRSLNHGKVFSNHSVDLVVLRESSHSTYKSQLYYSPTNSSLLSKEKPQIKCLHDGTTDALLEVMFVANNQTSADVHVQIISRGQIQHSSTKFIELTSGNFNIDETLLVEPLPPLKPGFTRGTFNIPITMTSMISPKPKVLIWYIREDGEVVIDSLELDVEKCLNYQVQMSWSKEKVAPGEQSTLNINSEPSSLCSVGVVDKSVELTSKDSSLTTDSLFGLLNYFEISEWENNQRDDDKYCQELEEKLKLEKEEKEKINITDSGLNKRSVIIRPPRVGFTTDQEDSFLTLQNSGLFTMSDLNLETRPCIERIAYNNYRPQAFAGAVADSGPSGASAGGFVDTKTGSSSGGETDARTYFPETWLWDLHSVGINGSWSQTYDLPDTITEWVGRSVCVHPTEGVGLSSATSITTFTPFFVDLILPAIVTRGEIIPIKISVFNYLDSNLPIRLVVHQSSEYDLLVGNSSDIQNDDRIFVQCIPTQDKEIFTVRLQPKSLGDVNITVSAQVEQTSLSDCPNIDNISKRDAIIKPMKVEAEGFPVERIWSKYICSRDENAGEVWDVTVPSVAVNGTARAWIYIAGDMMAPTLENLGNLIKMPYGCGEQNMINFAPNIFILQYLETSNQLTPRVTGKLKYFLRNGYQRQLRYRHKDGSFSVFGTSDLSGSTWLTAFVVKSFAHATNHILIDQSSLNQSATWLIEKIAPDGCFEPVGEVLHKGMKGGVAQGVSPLLHTAYVMISLLESKLNISDEWVPNAVNCLKLHNDPSFYAQALKAYGLALANDPDASSVIDLLIKGSIETENNMWWRLKELGDNSDAVEVETASYVIIAMMKIDPKKYNDNAWKIIRWISTKRNAQGGFISTQDTVVALQALATFEMHQPRHPQNVTVDISATNLNESVNVNDLNKLLQQKTSLPEIPANVSLALNGNGCALSQAVLRYNSPYPVRQLSFKLNIKTDTTMDRSCKMKTIEVCASYSWKNDTKSNMALIEINLITGYSPVKEDLKETKWQGIKRYEVDGRKVTFYVDYLTNQETCAKFRVIRNINVENPQPGTVKVFDYYQPHFEVSESYELESPDFCNYEQDQEGSLGLMVPHICWRRPWKRPVEDTNEETPTRSVTAGETTLSTWCLPKNNFEELEKSISG